MKIPTSLLNRTAGKKNRGMAILALVMLAVATIGGIWGYSIFTPGKNQITSLGEDWLRFGRDPCPGCGTG